MQERPEAANGSGQPCLSGPNFFFFNVIAGSEFAMFGIVTVRTPLTFLVSSELGTEQPREVCLKALQDLFSEAPSLSFVTLSIKFRGLRVLHVQRGAEGECLVPCLLLLCRDLLGHEAR